ncbi:CPBP family intramembrane metalloprotease [Lactobacillus sp. ESL0731]|uniref:CPBP family intramembrane glutamic endopeptidase n=1 Tax=unclassified Lactobacillus TaxID=2620435 RepID=UPI0023F82DEC|nr:MULTISPECIES: CPBP family intramembrane glutamic endopeptidase [unclassified Lactobacillus]WEV51373.1 CPBP family intramembrane metalloprotease [Lactobacillus sp. ESL0700]WEV62503.1 CPBP family intramembrane metalloprotease [Lactobacillus sp. ESL0731]
MKKFKVSNDSVWTPVLFFAVMEVAFVVIAYGLMLLPGLGLSALYHFRILSRGALLTAANNLEVPLIIIRYILAIWLLLTLNKKWLQEPLHFKNWHWSLGTIFVALIALIVYSYGFTTTKFSLNMNLCFIFGPAIFEEIWFRGIILSALVRRLSQRKFGVFFALLISAIIFGCGHIIGNNQPTLLDLIVQVVNATGFGFLVGALYLRSKNLFLPMMLHFINDFGVYFFSLGWEDLLPLSAVGCTILELVVCVCAAILLIHNFNSQAWLEGNMSKLYF